MGEMGEMGETERWERLERWRLITWKALSSAPWDAAAALTRLRACGAEALRTNCIDFLLARENIVIYCQRSATL
jgi:hypothetical protein